MRPNSPIPADGGFDHTLTTMALLQDYGSVMALDGEAHRSTWVLLDLYGTDMHPAIWGDPGVFRPERFERHESSGFDLVPQGGGGHYAGHRCPGEAATVDLLKSAAKLFATEIVYEVPPQDLTIDLGRIPTLPACGMVIGKARPRA